MTELRSGLAMLARAGPYRALDHFAAQGGSHAAQSCAAALPAELAYRHTRISKAMFAQQPPASLSHWFSALGTVAAQLRIVCSNS